MGNFDRGTLPEELVGEIEVRTLVISDGASPNFFTHTGIRITQVLPDGHHKVLVGQD